MDCRDFLRLADACRMGDRSRYACALIEWHRRTCPRCAAAMARPTTARRAPSTRQHATSGARTA